MNTLNNLSPRLEEYRLAQQARYAKEHEANMEKYPWIREATEAYRNATPEQLAQVEAILRKRGQIKWLHYYVAYAIPKCQAKTLLVMMSLHVLRVGKIKAYQHKILSGTSVLTN